MSNLIQAAWDAVLGVRVGHPLVHQIANLVVMNDVANATLALGALPVMAVDPAEVGEMARQADALVLNLGTPLEERFTAMAIAGAAANAAGRPVVVDPVGYGATVWRTAKTAALLDAIRPAVIRGNSGEITRLCGTYGEVRGVESFAADERIEEVVRQAAADRGHVVVASGAIDLVTDGVRFARVANGVPMLARITGSGCIATTAIACCAAVVDDYFVAAVAGALVMGIAGELAAAEAAGPGSFRPALFDALANLDRETFRQLARIEVEG